MKKILYRMIIVPLFIMLVSCAGREVAYGEEIDYEIGLILSDTDGVRYESLEGTPLYTSKSLVIRAGLPEREIEGEVIRQSCYYAFSYDMGESFGNLVELDEEGVVLSPQNDGDEYFIKVFRTYEVENLEEEGYVEETYESKCCHIIFDTLPPSINQNDETDFSKWVNYVRTASFKVVENASSVERVIVKDNGELVYEYHIDENLKVGSKEIDFEISLNRESSDCSGRTIEITTYDSAGNLSEESFTYYLDMTKPTVECMGIANRAIYNAAVNYTVNVVDNIINTDKLAINESAKIGDRTVKSFEKVIEADQNKVTYTEQLLEDGDYEIVLWAYDLAGNESDRIKIEVRVDLTFPKIYIEGFDEGADYRRRLDAKIIVVEDFFSDTSVDYRIVRKWPKGEALTYNQESTPDSYEYKKNISFEEDGDYYIKVTATDKAGNSTTKTSLLRIDKTAPEISLAGIQDNSTTNQMPLVFINAKEMFFDGAKIIASLFDENDLGILEKVIEEEYVMPDDSLMIPMQINKEGKYILVVQGKDRSGNESQCKLEFTFDCTAPTIRWLSGINKKYLKSVTFPARFITNISDKTSSTYKAYLNAYELKEGTSIEKDGKYVLRIIATDLAGNVSDETAEFIIDNTPPKIVIRGIDKNTFKPGDTFTVSLLDKNDKFDMISFDGKKMDTKDDGKKCDITITDSKEHKLLVKASDEAGNETEKLIVLSASVLKSPEKIVEKISKIYKDEGENEKEIIDKNEPKKYVYISISLVLGVLVLIAVKLKVLRHIDVAK